MTQEEKQARCYVCGRKKRVTDGVCFRCEQLEAAEALTREDENAEVTNAA